MSNALHRKIFDTLFLEIGSGQRQPGERLPTEAKLMQHFYASRTTVSRALHDLEAKGLIRRRRGSGTFVLETQGRSAGASLAQFIPSVESGAPLTHVEGSIQQHLADIASRSGNPLVLQCLPPGNLPLAERARAAADDLIRRGVKGVLYHPAEPPAAPPGLNREVANQLARAGVAVVLAGRDIDPFPARSTFPRVTFDHRRAGYLLADQLLRAGCRRIAFLGRAPAPEALLERLAGFREAHLAHGAPADAKLVRLSERFSASSCRDLVTHGRPDAIICETDRAAAQVGRVLAELGLGVGRDIRLAGCEDEPLASLLPVPLTTVRLPARAFARACHEALVRRIHDAEAEAVQIVVDCEIVVRASTCGAAVPGEK